MSLNSCVSLCIEISPGISGPKLKLLPFFLSPSVIPFSSVAVSVVAVVAVVVSVVVSVGAVVVSVGAVVSVAVAVVVSVAVAVATVPSLPSSLELLAFSEVCCSTADTAAIAILSGSAPPIIFIRRCFRRICRILRYFSFKYSKT